MKREIIFRAKSINTNEWVKSLTIAKGTIKRKCNNFYFELEEDKWIGVISETIGQFTGLKDKNEKDIFEDDICIVPYLKNEKTIGVIEFKNGAFIFQSKEDPSLQVVGWSLINQKQIEVIGNILFILI